METFIFRAHSEFYKPSLLAPLKQNCAQQTHCTHPPQHPKRCSIFIFKIWLYIKWGGEGFFRFPTLLVSCVVYCVLCCVVLLLGMRTFPIEEKWNIFVGCVETSLDLNKMLMHEQDCWDDAGGYFFFSSASYPQTHGRIKFKPNFRILEHAKHACPYVQYPNYTEHRLLFYFYSGMDNVLHTLGGCAFSGAVRTQNCSGIVWRVCVSVCLCVFEENEIW